MSWQRLVASSLALLWCASVAHGACSVTEKEGRITLENDHLRVALVPAQGGKCASVFFKVLPENAYLGLDEKERTFVTFRGS